MPDMSPDEAASYATGGADDSDGLTDGLDGDSFDSGGAGGSTPVDRLFDGDAEGPSLTDLEADYGMNKWLSVTSRGILRTATGSGIPPFFEILIGSALGYTKLKDAGSDADQADADSEADSTAGLETTVNEL